MGCAIALVLVILCGFGTACYGYFGAETKQAITLNLSRGSDLVLALWSFILVSILLTFPLQAFPIFLAVEDVWTIDHRILFLLRRAAITACCTGDAAAAAAAADGIAVECCVVHIIYCSLPTSLHVRSCLLSGVAYLAQNSFAYVKQPLISIPVLCFIQKLCCRYVGAINGSIGCALLLFVIPCAIDLKLNAHATVLVP